MSGFVLSDFPAWAHAGTGRQHFYRPHIFAPFAGDGVMIAACGRGDNIRDLKAAEGGRCKSCERIVSSIKLKCPKCHRVQTAHRAEFDPPNAVRVEIACPSCNAGDFGEPAFFDAEGRSINEDPATLSPRAAQHRGA